MPEGAHVIVRAADAVSGVEYVLPCTVAWVHRGAPNTIALGVDGIPSRTNFFSPVDAQARRLPCDGEAPAARRIGKGITARLASRGIPADDARMIPSSSEARATAARVTKWLLEKGRRDDALAVAAAWAARGPNDAAGQQLLAEALRIDPAAPLAKLAFERMEGIATSAGPLDAAMQRFDLDALLKLEKEMTRPAFRRAQVGFNNNIKFQDQVFHVQTEDSGLDKPHIITHLFADGGRIIKSHKRNYADAVGRADVGTYVRALMKGQHIEMAVLLREGAFDEIIAGRAIGGMQLLEEPPRTEVQKLATQKKQRVEAAAPPSERAVPAVGAAVYFRLRVVRTLGTGPDVYAPPGEEAVIGSQGVISLPGETFVTPAKRSSAFGPDASGCVTSRAETVCSSGRGHP